MDRGLKVEFGIKSQNYQQAKKEWARLYADESQESSEALDLLRDSNYPVITFQIKGKLGPELVLGRRVFHGLIEIKSLIGKEEE